MLEFKIKFHFLHVLSVRKDQGHPCKAAFVHKCVWLTGANIKSLQFHRSVLSSGCKYWELQMIPFPVNAVCVSRGREVLQSLSSTGLLVLLFLAQQELSEGIFILQLLSDP